MSDPKSIPLHELIKNLQISILTGSESDNNYQPLKSFYQKGYSKNLPYNSWVTIGCTNTIKSIFLPSSNQATQISSSSSSDTLLPILVKGYDSSNNEISEVIVLNATNSRTPVTLVNSYFRINTMINLGTSNNVGNIYLSKDSASLTLGTPAEADCMYIMKEGDNLGSIMNYYIPGKDGGKLYPDYVLYSVTNDTYSEPKIEFQTKYASSQIWLNQFVFYVDDQTQSNFSYNLKGIPGIDNPAGGGLDIRIRCNKMLNFGTLHISCGYSSNC